MAETKDVATPDRRTWVWYIERIVVWFVVCLVVAAPIAGVWKFYEAVAVSLQAEENLHATLFTIRLVEQFVHENGRWPKSWAELEQMRFPSDAPSPLGGELSAIRIGGAHGYDWPSQSTHLRECVAIDFGAAPETVITKDPLEFDAIKPIGPHYEYRDYGFVESLQETLKRTAEK